MSKKKKEPTLEELEAREAALRYQKTICKRCGAMRTEHIELFGTAAYNLSGNTNLLLCPTNIFEE